MFSFFSSPVSTPSNPLSIKVENNQLIFYDPNKPSQDKLAITFHRTLRIPDDGKTYPLPPSLGTFPIKRVDDYLNKVPEKWKKQGGVFLPLFQREAMWLSFNNQSQNHPHALKVAVGKVNALSGEMWNEDLQQKQDYCVTPQQPWLDGINSGEGTISQFVAMPLGQGYTVEAQVTGEEKTGGVQLVCFNAKEDARKKRFPTVIPSTNYRKEKKKKCLAFSKSASLSMDEECDQCSFAPCPSMAQPKCNSVSSQSIQRKKSEAKELGLAAGGKMKQQIVQDPYGAEFWDLNSKCRVFVHIVNSEMYKEITGETAPETPISAKTYSSYNYPWYDHYCEGVGNVPKSNILSNVKTVKQIDQEKYAWAQQDDSSVKINHVHTTKSKFDVRDGEW